MQKEIKEIVKNKTFSPVKIFNFNEAYKVPEYRENKSHHFVEWGSDNQYPLYILNLYNNYGSTTHKSIVDRKVRLTTGFGLNDIEDPTLQEYVNKNKMEKLLRQINSDLELFNSYCMLIIWNNEGTSFDLQYIPISKIRRGLYTDEVDYDHFWYCKDWKQYKKDEYKPEFIRAYDPNIRKGRQLFYYIQNNPVHDNVYGIPQYSTGINYIELDYEISKYHLNQIKQGFQPSFVLSINSGVPSLEEQEAFYKEFSKSFSGTENGGRILITYSDSKEEAPTLEAVQLNDGDQRFVMLQDMVERNIVQTHAIPPQLIILTPGKLGSTQERNELLSEFQSFYISSKQQEIEYEFNNLLKTIGFTEELSLKTYADENIQDDIQQREKEDIQGILLVQQSVASGITSYESAIQMMILLYGFTEEEAKLIIGQPKTTEPIKEITQNYI